MAISLQQNVSGNWGEIAEQLLILPPTFSQAGATKSVPLGASIAFVGPNGAGKSRMAAWLDQNNLVSLYLRARRSVVMPKSYAVAPEELEYATILAGQRIQNDSAQPKQIRYMEIGDRDYFSDNDFQNVLNILGSRHATTAVKFRRDYDPKYPPVAPPRSELDKTIEIWHDVLPHLRIDSGNVPTLMVSRTDDGETVTYSPKDMSDGEKAIFYLIGKCMIAQAGSIIVVDEPEMYVHRSVRNRLWNKIEKSRRDCIFIYLTHDLDFVRTRQFHLSFVVLKYRKRPREQWEYSEFPLDPSADEALQLTVWGNRQPTLLVEGTTDSIDLRILSLVYPEFLIVPAGSCDDVRQSVAALRRQKSFHHQDIFGLIDRDARSEDEIAALRKKGVHCLKFREIENVLVSSEALEFVLKQLGHPRESLATAEQEILKPLQKKFKNLEENRAFQSAKRDILNEFEARLAEINSPNVELDSLNTARITGLYSYHREILSNTITNGTWNDKLSFFSVRKDDFGGVVANALKFKDFAAYRETLFRLAEQSDEVGNRAKRALMVHLPKLR